MARQRNAKERPEAESWKPMFNADLLWRIKNIVEQTGLSPSDLALKWFFKKKHLLG
jgi:ribosome-binding protein aMBF1 (putative translation factor)